VFQKKDAAPAAQRAGGDLHAIYRRGHADDEAGIKAVPVRFLIAGDGEALVPSVVPVVQVGAMKGERMDRGPAKRAG
jgi:hypothetical protein